MILLDLFGLYSQVSSKTLEECKEFTVELDNTVNLGTIIKEIESGDEQRWYNRQIVMVREEDGSKVIEGKYHNLSLKSLFYWLYWYSFKLKLTRADGSIKITGIIDLDFPPWSAMFKVWCTIILLMATFLILMLGFSDSSIGRTTERIGFFIFMLIGLSVVSLLFWIIYRLWENVHKTKVKILVNEMIEDLKSSSESS